MLAPYSHNRQRRNSPLHSTHFSDWDRENALACIVLYMFIAQHCEYKKEKKKKKKFMTTSNFQINICPLKSLIAAAAHSLICCSLYVLTSSPFFFPLPWLREFVASKLHSVTAKQTTFCAFCVFFPISLSMTEISCLPPTDHHPSISSFLFLCCPVLLQTARTLTSTLMMAGVNPKFYLFHQFHAYE